MSKTTVRAIATEGGGLPRTSVALTESATDLIFEVQAITGSSASSAGALTMTFDEIPVETFGILAIA